MVSPIFALTSSPWVYRAVRILLGVVLIWASLSKIANPGAFAEIVSNYRILPAALVNPTALLLPWVEALCGVALISGRLVGGAALIFVGLMTLFLIVTAVTMYRGIDVTCGCFSVIASEKPGSQVVNLLRNAVLLTLGAFLLWRAGQAKPTG